MPASANAATCGRRRSLGSYPRALAYGQAGRRRALGGREKSLLSRLPRLSRKLECRGAEVGQGFPDSLMGAHQTPGPEPDHRNSSWGILKECEPECVRESSA